MEPPISGRHAAGAFQLAGLMAGNPAQLAGGHLLLLDLAPGSGRDRLLHDLELGRAHECVPTPGGVLVLVLRDEGICRPAWPPLRQIGLQLGPWKEPSRHAAHAISQPAVA